MNNIRLSRIFRFETAHALLGYDGACRNIHGHSYKLVVTIIGKPLHNPNHPKNGMVMDFGDLKNIVNNAVINIFDHALLLNNATPADLVKQLQHNHEKLVLLPYQPSCENMLLDIKDKIEPLLPEQIKLHSLKLSETENSFAEWHFSDQKTISEDLVLAEIEQYKIIAN